MLNLVSGALTLGAYVPYVAAILRGQTKPSRASWWMWAGVGFLLLSTYYSLGSRGALGLALGAFIGQTLVSVLALRYGIGGGTRFDFFCLAGAAGAAMLWWATASPFWPHVLVVAMDACAWLPTFRKTWKDPASEDAFAWMLWTAAAVLALLNTRQWTVAEALYPLYIVVSDGIIVLLIGLHRWAVRST